MQFILNKTRGISSFQNDEGGYFSLPAKLLQLVESLGEWVVVLVTTLKPGSGGGKGGSLGEAIALAICSWQPFIQ